jgi:MerR family transcriptional regulator/heat shock protein HspR
MDERFWTITEITEQFQIDEHFLMDLEEEEILCPTCLENTANKLFAESELEKLRLAKLLMEDMGVNLAGVDIILRMRRDMFALRNQFDEILEDLAKQWKERL